MRKEEILYLNIELSEIYAKTEVTQYYENKTDHPLELKINIPFSEGIYISTFKAKIGDKIIESKIMEKEKAKEKYNDIIASNRSAFLTWFIENDFGKHFYVCLGNIKPRNKNRIHILLLSVYRYIQFKLLLLHDDQLSKV